MIFIEQYEKTQFVWLVQTYKSFSYAWLITGLGQLITLLLTYIYICSLISMWILRELIRFIATYIGSIYTIVVGIA